MCHFQAFNFTSILDFRLGFSFFSFQRRWNFIGRDVWNLIEQSLGSFLTSVLFVFWIIGLQMNI